MRLKISDVLRVFLGLNFQFVIYDYLFLLDLWLLLLNDTPNEEALIDI